MLALVTSRVVGVLFVGAGLMFFVVGEPEDAYHNALHLATGVVALVVGLRGSRIGARQFCVWAGAAYLAFGLTGLVAGDPAMDRMWHIGPLHLATAEHVFHVVLGTIVLAAGLLSPVTVRSG